MKRVWLHSSLKKNDLTEVRKGFRGIQIDKCGDRHLMIDMTTKLMTYEVSVHHAGHNVQDALEISASDGNAQMSRTSHLKLVLLPGVALAPDVLLQVHVVFERLSGGREGNRGQKLNHQTTKHTHGKREGEKGKVEEEREGRGKQSFSFFIPRERKERNG